MVKEGREGGRFHAELMTWAKPTEPRKSILETTDNSQNGVEAEGEVGPAHDKDSGIRLFAILATRGTAG